MLAAMTHPSRVLNYIYIYKQNSAFFSSVMGQWMRHLDGADVDRRWKPWTEVVGYRQKKLQASNRSNLMHPTETPLGASFV